MSTPQGIAIRKRVNVSLPQATIQLLDRVAEPGSRSAFVDRAVHFYVRTVGQANLKEKLRQGATNNARRDLTLAEEWFAID